MFNRKQEYKMLNRMLDDAISGEFEETIYDERELSKLQTKLEHYLRSSAISARKVEAEKDNLKELLTNISHQTKTPLTNILLYAQLLDEKADSDEIKMYTNEILLSAKKLEMLIQALVKMSRLETGIFQFEPGQCSLKSIVDACMDMGKTNAFEKNISIQFNAESYAIVLSDKKWTIEAVYNILDNALKYSNSPSTVYIDLFQYELFAGIRVTDRGFGLAEEEIPRIFGRFYRGKDVHDKEGIGVGLFLSREIIEKQGGYIKVVSEKGKGSAFEIYLPIFQY